MYQAVWCDGVRWCAMVCAAVYTVIYHYANSNGYGTFVLSSISRRRLIVWECGNVWELRVDNTQYIRLWEFYKFITAANSNYSTRIF